MRSCYCIWFSYNSLMRWIRKFSILGLWVFCVSCSLLGNGKLWFHFQIFGHYLLCYVELLTLNIYTWYLVSPVLRQGAETGNHYRSWSLLWSFDLHHLSSHPCTFNLSSWFRVIIQFVLTVAGMLLLLYF